MRICEIIEGRYDPYTGKAIFFAGGAGSGKTFIARKLASVFYGMKQVNPDAALKLLMKRAGLDLKMPDREEPKREPLRQYSKQVTGKQQELYKKEKLGMLIDTTGRSYPTIENMKQELEAQDYDTAMVFVDADLKTQIKRNRMRQRQVPEKVISNNYDAIKQNMDRYRQLFGDNFYYINNSESVRTDINSGIDQLQKDLNIFLNEKS
jgi:cytidylate kinase